MFQKTQQPHCAWVAAEFVATLEFDHHGPCFGYVWIDCSAVEFARHLIESVSQCPFWLVQFERQAVDESQAVSGKIPCRVCQKTPIHELPSRVIRVCVVVENVLRAHATESDCEPGHVLFASEMDLIVLDFLLFPAEPEGLANNCAAKVYIRNRRSQTEGFSVWESGHPQCISNAVTLPH